MIPVRSEGGLASAPPGSTGMARVRPIPVTQSEQACGTTRIDV